MELRQLEYFLRVASEGSISRAALSLHMTQPPLSISIAKLEAELGVPLLTRESRGIRLTEAGMYFAEHSERILQDLESLRDDMRNRNIGAAGRVSIAAVPTITWFLLPHLLERFLASHPATDVSVIDPPPAKVIEMVLAKEIDIGIIATLSCEQLQDSYRQSLNVFHAGDLRMLAALPPSFSDSEGPVSLADLHDQPWIIPRRSLRIRGLPELFDSLWERLHLTPPIIRRVATLQTAIPLVAAGLGVALVPESVRGVADTRIILREIADPIPPLQAAAIWSREHAPSRTAEAFLSTLRQEGLGLFTK
ncbi:MAG: LysR family transcriptional regulator [Arthrobacter sp.]|nr:LysR family transcriptional regulator [Arthrobacter sp.]MDZ4351410.1 LysR family transcriptional regulator [Arthrobacter sp.]